MVPRGEGQDEAGTIVFATAAIQRDFILVNGMLNSAMGTMEKQQTLVKTKEMMPTNGYKGSKKPTTTTMNNVYVPVGETHIPVESIEGFSVGERILVCLCLSDLIKSNEGFLYVQFRSHAYAPFLHTIDRASRIGRVDQRYRHG